MTLKPGQIHNLPMGAVEVPVKQGASAEETALPSAQKLNVLLAADAARGPALEAFEVIIPGLASNWLRRFPYVYDYLTFWFQSAPTAPIRFGPQGPSIRVAVACAITLPGTALEFRFDNPNATPYSLMVLGVAGLPPVVIDFEVTA